MRQDGRVNYLKKLEVCSTMCQRYFGVTFPSSWHRCCLWFNIAFLEAAISYSLGLFVHVYPLSSRNSLWHKRFTSRRMRIETRVSSRDITKKTQTVSWPKFPSVTWTFMMAPIFPWKAKTLCKNSDFKYIHYYIIYTLYILQPMIVLGYHLYQS